MNAATTENRLMIRYADGDVAAFQRLFALLAPRLRAFFRRSFADSAVADDLIQTTFLKLHSARSAYRPEEPLEPWVFAIAAAVRGDELRRRYRWPRPAADDELESAESGAFLAESGAGEAEREEELARMRAAIQRLPESQRAVLELHCYEELTFEKIAEALGTTPGAVRVRASRAYQRLREQLARRERLQRFE